MRASLLFYRKLRKELEAYGFKIDPYDPCVANKITDAEKQLTVVWHVDDLMGKCKDNFDLTKFSCSSKCLPKQTLPRVTSRIT
jgi:hypothetical protein